MTKYCWEKHHLVDYGTLKMTFGKYKGALVTFVLLTNPMYFGWCHVNVPYFKFSIRDLEMYLDFACLWENRLQVLGYANKYEIIDTITDRFKRGIYDKYPNDQYLTPKTVAEYIQKRKKSK